jgi:hypothetical protein
MQSLTGAAIGHPFHHRTVKLTVIKDNFNLNDETGFSLPGVRRLCLLMLKSTAKTGFSLTNHKFHCF